MLFEPLEEEFYLPTIAIQFHYNNMEDFLLVKVLFDFTFARLSDFSGGFTGSVTSYDCPKTSGVSFNLEDCACKGTTFFSLLQGCLNFREDYSLFGVMLLTREAVYLFGSDSLSWGVMLVFTLLVVWGWVVTLPSGGP